MRPQDFIGTWKLEKMEMTDAAGNVSEPYGPRPLGFITYTTDGRMHAILMDSGRALVGMRPGEIGRRHGLRRFVFLLRRIPALARSAEAALRSTAYSARWEIRDCKVVHHVDASVLPDMMGIDLIRTYTFEGDTLTLTTEPSEGESISLRWRKV